MTNISLDLSQVFGFVAKDQVYAYKDQALAANRALHDKSGKGNDFLGWVGLPSAINDAHLQDILSTAESFKSKLDVLVVIGIGGSYLGAKSVIEALSHNFNMMLTEREAPLVLFAGQQIGEDYLHDLKAVLKGKSWGIVVISKSGTTTEPAIAFRLLKQQLEEEFGEAESKTRIVAITDANKGALRSLVTSEGYKSFVIPDDVGGRYSVLTPVGLFPIACAGVDIGQFVAGARDMERVCSTDTAFEDNPAALYAAARNALYKTNKKIEILVNYEPRLHFIAEWWKQLYGESEGKDGLGIYPASVDFTSDLHSMGQYIQDGERTLFETVISVAQADNEVRIPEDNANLDKLNYLSGKRVDEVNKMAELGTMLAHVDGGVPNMKITLPQLSAYYLGQLLYMFEKACGISGYILDVNPFDQPGVEAYKSNMFALLGKPGYEKQTEDIRKRL